VAENALAVSVRLERRKGDARFLDVTLDAPPGITVLFGPSGAGKSTLLSIVTGLLSPSSGRVTLGARVLYDSEGRVNVAPHRRKLALVFQSLALFPHLSVADNVRYGVPKNRDTAERRRVAARWCERMRLDHVIDRRPATLSGGEAQRVALARALASEPEALLLDEPFTALDSALRAELEAELRSVIDELRVPALLVTHDRPVARALGDRAVGIEAGRVTRAGSVAEVVGEG
jgi:molybdate transport system ATP-binding protein